MMKTRLFGILMVTLVMTRPSAVHAQDTCPDIVDTALAVTRDNCAGTQRNHACYGHGLLEAVPHAGVGSFIFYREGDTVPVSGVQSLRLGAMDEDAGMWGVALLSVQANLPNTLPGQNVTFILFGDVELQNAVRPLLPGEDAYIHTTEGDRLNIRGGPGAGYEVVVGAPDGTRVRVLDGPRRSGDMDWWHIRLSSGQDGWAAEDVDDRGQRLATLVRDPGLYEGPMQAYYFRSGIGDAPCAAAPDSGILIQTPQGAGELSLVANSVNIDIASTVFMQAQASGDMLVNVVEGQARVTANGGAQTATAGTRVRVALDANLRPAGQPGAPEPYDQGAMQRLPVWLLPRTVTVAPAASSAASINFWADRASINAGECLTLSWDVRNIREVYYQGQGKTGQGSAQECPAQTTTYTLRVVLVDGSERYESVTVTVLPQIVLGTGDVQVTLTWDNQSDLDLHVIEPNGTEIDFASRYSNTGGQLDVDANYPCGANLYYTENIFWPRGYAPGGTYQVYVTEVSLCNAAYSAAWTLVVRVDGQVIMTQQGAGNSTLFTFSRGRLR